MLNSYEMRILKSISEKDVIKLAKSIIKINTENPPGNEAPLAQFLSKYFDTIGLYIQLDEPISGRPNVLAILEGYEDYPRLIFNGHMDTVPAGDEWIVPPYDGIIKDGRLYGRGAADMKGGLAAMIMAASTLKAAKVPLRGSLILQNVIDEEITGSGTKFYTKKGLDAEYGIICEPTELKPCIAHKGRISYIIETFGKASHAGTPEKGVNAITSMLALLNEVTDYGEKLKMRKHPLLGHPTSTITTISGGLKTNIIPDRCKASIDRRLIPGESVESVLKEFTTMIKDKKLDPNSRVKTKVSTAIGSMETNGSTPPASTILKVLSEIAPDKAQFTGFEATCDGYFLKELAGIPTIICGPGSLSQAHTPNEYLKINELLDACKIYTLTALKLLM